MKVQMLLLGLALIPVACTDKEGAGKQLRASEPESHLAKSSQKHDPCSLITKEEMSQVTGEQFIEAKSETNSKTCTYMTADASVGSAEVSSTWDEAEAQAMIPAMKAGAELTKLTPADGTQMVPGLGNEASFATYALTVRKGDAAFMIRLNLPSRFAQGMRQEGGKGPQKYADDILAMDKALAEKALTRL
jgi:hypothetical protein